MKKLIAFVIVFVFILCLLSCSKEAVSIGIIGGADGPTAMLVTTTINWLSICGLIGLAVVTILVVRIIHRKKK